MFPENTPDTTQYAQPKAGNPLDTLTVTSDVPKRPSKLAVWTLVSNVVYYALPLFATGLYVSAVKLHWVNPDLAAEQIIIFNIGFAFFGAGTLLGVLSITLDAIYLAKAKPLGKSKVLTIISINIAIVATILAFMLIVFSIGLSGAMS